MSKQSSTNPIKDFEKHLSELEAIVAKMEKETLDLESALAQFEKGMLLSQQCQTALDNAKQKVDFILSQAQNETSGRS